MSDNLFGFFLRDSAHGKVVGNRSHDNCVGLINLNTGSNEAGDYSIAGNVFTHNDKFCPGTTKRGRRRCPASAWRSPAATGNTVVGNVITNNVAERRRRVLGRRGGHRRRMPGADPPADNVVKGNVITGNQPDIFTDGSGTGNVFFANVCTTSVPGGLC